MPPPRRPPYRGPDSTLHPDGEHHPMTFPEPPQQAPQAPQDPPAAPGHPARPAPGADLGADLGAALTFAGRALLRNWLPFLVVGLLYSAIATVLVVGGIAAGIAAMLPMAESASPGDDVPPQAILVFYGIVTLAIVLMVPFMLLWQSGSARAAEVILDGGRPTLRQALVGPFRVILTALLVGAITVVGLMLLYIPGLIAGVLLMFAIPAAARGASPLEALTQSVALVRANLATAIVTYLVISVIGSLAGFLLITVIALIPFLLLFEIGMFERLSGRELPEPTARA